MVNFQDWGSTPPQSAARMTTSPIERALRENQLAKGYVAKLGRPTIVPLPFDKRDLTLPTRFRIARAKGRLTGRACEEVLAEEIQARTEIAIDQLRMAKTEGRAVLLADHQQRMVLVQECVFRVLADSQVGLGRQLVERLRLAAEAAYDEKKKIDERTATGALSLIDAATLEQTAGRVFQLLASRLEEVFVRLIQVQLDQFLRTFPEN